MNKSPATTFHPKEAKSPSDIRLVAFYLPQFHPIKENDEWWGKGFTEWTNVTKAIPLLAGHYQPHLPTELGFYDLRLREVRREQIHLAKSHGIDAFCYYYYWFSGKRLLEAPLEDMLADAESDIPFCLCWANENWTRRWNGGDQDILIEQKYLSEDPSNFIRDIACYLSDSRYLRIDGKPLLIIYRPQEIPNIKAVAQEWRCRCRALGIGEIHLSAALTFNNLDYSQFGFDSGVEFPPHNRVVLGISDINRKLNFNRTFQGYAMMFHELAYAYLNRDRREQNIFRGVCPSWDNTARTQERALFFINGTPGNYEYWLSQAIQKSQQDRPGSDRLVFINAWNEWAEGCHLEPDRKYKREFLEATLRAKLGLSTLTDFPDMDIPKNAAMGFSAFLADLKELLKRYTSFFMGRCNEIIKVNLARNPRFKRILKSLFFRSGLRDKSQSNSAGGSRTSYKLRNPKQ